VEGLGRNDLEPKVHCVEPTVQHGMVVEEGNDLVRVSKDLGREFVVHSPFIPAPPPVFDGFPWVCIPACLAFKCGAEATRILD